MSDELGTLGINPPGTVPLHPDLHLQRFRDGFAFIKHKYVNDMYFPGMEQRYNDQLVYKIKAVSDALEQGNFHTFVFLHERPWRRDALEQLALEQRLSDAGYWHLLRDVWIDSENIPECAEEWDTMLRSERSERQAMMHDDEREALAALPEAITVYQGHTDERDDGWSWTTSRETATWFARRFANLEQAEEAIVTTATVRRAQVTAYLLTRGEHEVLAAPEALTFVTEEVVSRPDADS